MNVHLKHTVFPILPYRPDGSRVYCDPEEQGSAFFITKRGFFLTAGHVVNKWSADSYAVVAVHHELKGYKACRVLEICRHAELDIAIGLAELPSSNGWPYPFALGSATLGANAAVYTYGYAKTQPERCPTGDSSGELDCSLTLHMHPRPYTGYVIEHLLRGPLIPAPCYHVSCDPGRGISGGPLIRKRTGSVHGVFVSGIPNHEEGGTETGFAMDLGPILDEWRIPVLDSLTLREYANLNPTQLSVR